MDIQRIRDGFQTCQAAGLNNVLDDQQLGQILAAPRTHKEQPLLYVVRAAIDPNQNAAATAWNTEYAIRNIQARGNEQLKQWLPVAVSKACDVAAFENASGALGEIRAAGTMVMVGADVEPIPEEKGKKTPDFKVTFAERTIYVEVHTKNIAGEEARKLHKFNQGSTGTHVVRPAGGKPNDPDETTVENIAQKFSAIKSKGLQAVPDEPGILWLDLQDEDWWTLSARDAEVAWIGNDGAFFTSGLWHAFYGTKGTKMLEGQTVERRAMEVAIAMRGCPAPC